MHAGDAVVNGGAGEDNWGPLQICVEERSAVSPYNGYVCLFVRLVRKQRVDTNAILQNPSGGLDIIHNLIIVKYDPSGNIMDYYCTYTYVIGQIWNQ